MEFLFYHFGRNLYSNFSGALSWLRKCIDRILGLYPDFDRLIIDPCIPRHWDEYRVEKLWRGCRVEMSVRNADNVCAGVVSASLDGAALPVAGGRSSIPAASLTDGGKSRVEVVMG